MSGKNVLLTGVSQGLGLYLCHRLYMEKFNVIGIDLQTETNLQPEVKKILFKLK